MGSHSKLSGEDNTTAFPHITPKTMTEWDLRIRAWLNARDLLEAITENKPVIDRARVERYRRERRYEARRRYQRRFEQKLKRWKKKNAKAYNILMQACTTEATAMTVIMSNKEATAKQIYEKLTSQFSLMEITSVKAARLSEFYQINPGSEEDPTNFIDRILRARIGLHELGCNYVDLEVYCLPRLIDGLSRDGRFQHVAVNLQATPGMTWAKAVQIVTSYQMTQGLDGGVKSAVSKNAQEALTIDTVRNLIHKEWKNKYKKRSREELNEKSTSNGKNDEPWYVKRGLTCHNCGKKGHIAKICTAPPQNSNGTEQVTRMRHVDSEDELGIEVMENHAVRMLSEVAEPQAESMRRAKETAVLDSGATAHMLGHETAEEVSSTDTELRECNVSIQTGKVGSALKPLGRTDVGALKEVLVLNENELAESVASVPRLDLDGYHVICGGGKARVGKLTQDGQFTTFVEAPLGPDKTYRFDLSELSTIPEQLLYGSAKEPVTLELVHDRLGHWNKRTLREGFVRGEIKGVNPTTLKHRVTPACGSCIKSKSRRYSFGTKGKEERPNQRCKAMRPLRRLIRKVVTDLKGPIAVDGPNGERYLQIFTEADTKFMVGYYLTAKDMAFSSVQQYILEEVQREGCELVEYHSDGALELVSAKLVEFLATIGVRVTYSAPYTPEQNPLAERKNQSVWQSAYAMWLNSVLPAMFWVWACRYAIIVANCIPTRTEKGWMSPLRAKYGIVPDVSLFRVWGCVAYVHVPVQTRDTTTFTEKAHKGYFLSLKWPDLNSYFVYLPSLDKVVESAHVQFDEVVKLKQPEHEFLIVDEQRKLPADFVHLVDCIFVETENDMKYVVTRVGRYRGYIVAWRAPLAGGRMGREDPDPFHAKDIEKLVQKFSDEHRLQRWNRIMNQVDVVLPTMASGVDSLLESQSEGVSQASQPGSESSVSASATPLHVGSTRPVNLSGGQIERRSLQNDGAVVGSNSASDTSTKEVRSQQPVDTSVPHERQVRFDQQDASVTTHATGSRQSSRIRTPRVLTNVNALGNIGSESEHETLRRMSEIDDVEKLAYLSAAPILENADEHNDKDIRWKEAKVAEMFSLIIENDCWEAIQRPADANIVTSRWVCRNKTHPVPKRKARLTARGYSQVYGVDYKETYAPVAKLSTLRVFLTLVTILCLYTSQSDLKTAFLNAFLAEDIYLLPVHDMIQVMEWLLESVVNDIHRSIIAKQLRILRSGGVLKLKKAIYGLKQAPREWWKALLTYLISLGFVPNEVDPCLLTLYLGPGTFVLLLLYVDDILVAATSQHLVDVIRSKLRSKFRVSSEGPIDNYLGINICIAPDWAHVRLNMSSYVNSMCSRFRVAVKQSVQTPMEENFQAALEDATLADETYVVQFQYREKIGCLMYFMICMCPQICYAVGLLARQTNKVSKIACAGVTRLLQYCLNISNQDLILSGDTAYITAFADSDWAGDRETRCSTGGWILFLGRGAIEWGSKLFTLPAQSAAEAEYLAMLEPGKSILSLRWLFKSTGIDKIITTYSSTLFGDNISSQTIAQNPVCSKRTKYIALKYHFIRKLFEAGVVYLERADTHSNVADMMTKSLGKRKLDVFAPQAWGEEEFVKAKKKVKTQTSDEFV